MNENMRNKNTVNIVSKIAKSKILTKILKGITIMSILGVLTGCVFKDNVDNYTQQKPTFDLQQYFKGNIKAWGIVQDYTGKVTRRFDVDLVGSWDGDEGTLDEVFNYYDGEVQNRIWKLKKIDNKNYTGSASDIVGQATGKVSGNAMQWAYQMDLAVGGRTYRITFDDWMFLMNDGVLINRSYLKKFGLTVGELTLFMQKQDNK